MRLFGYCLTVLLFISHDGYCVEFGPGDIFGEVTRVTTGAIKSIPNGIPSPQEFFELSKNALIGFPYEVVYTLINKFCSMALNENSILVPKKYTPDVSLMSFILKTKTSNISIPITNPDALWSHPEFNVSNPLVVFVTGWHTNLAKGASKAQDEMAAAYLCRGNINFVTLDTDAYVDTLYEWSAFNTEDIGVYISKSIQQLIKNFPLERIHLIGHSLGAQICGAAGRHFNQTTRLWIPRITGLDAANPCFNHGQELSGLFRGDGGFIDGVHTDGGCLGKKEAYADADFFCNGILPLQPGCFTASCAHSRAWKYYVETVYPGNEYNFLARACSSLVALDSHECIGPLIPMGYAAFAYAKGNFFLRTHPEKPYGENSRKYYEPVCAN